MNIDKELQSSTFLKQLLAELIAAQNQGIGLIVGAIAPHINAQQAAIDLSARIKAAQALGGCPKQAIDLAKAALASFEAETALQNRDRH